MLALSELWQNTKKSGKSDLFPVPCWCLVGATDARSGCERPECPERLKKASLEEVGGWGEGWAEVLRNGGLLTLLSPGQPFLWRHFQYCGAFSLGCLVCFRFPPMICIIVLHVSEGFGEGGIIFVYNDHRFRGRSLYVGEASRYGRVIQLSTTVALDRPRVTSTGVRSTSISRDRDSERRRESKIIVSKSCMLRET